MCPGLGPPLRGTGDSGERAAWVDCGSTQGLSGSQVDSVKLPDGMTSVSAGTGQEHDLLWPRLAMHKPSTRLSPHAVEHCFEPLARMTTVRSPMFEGRTH